jgi:hypothetical protein
MTWATLVCALAAFIAGYSIKSLSVKKFTKALTAPKKLKNEKLYYFDDIQKIIDSIVWLLEREEGKIEISNIRFEFPDAWVRSLTKPKVNYNYIINGWTEGKTYIRYAGDKVVYEWKCYGDGKTVAKNFLAFIKAKDIMLFSSSGVKRESHPMGLSFDIKRMNMEDEKETQTIKKIEISKEELIAKLASIIEINNLSDNSLNEAVEQLKEDGVDLEIKSSLPKPTNVSMNERYPHERYPSVEELNKLAELIAKDEQKSTKKRTRKKIIQ